MNRTEEKFKGVSFHSPEGLLIFRSASIEAVPRPHSSPFDLLKKRKDGDHNLNSLMAYETLIRSRLGTHLSHSRIPFSTRHKNNSKKKQT